MSKRKKDNKNYGWFKARKEYTCDLTGKRIKIGEDYYRINLPYSGIRHFHKSCKKADIDAYIEELVGEDEFDLDFLDYPGCTASDDSEAAYIESHW